MKRLFLLSIIIGVGTTALPLHSQAPVPKPAAPIVVTGSPLEQLRAIREQNAKLLEQQDATLKRLEELEKDSQTLKVLGRRS